MKRPKQSDEAALGLRVARQHAARCPGSHKNFPAGDGHWNSSLDLTTETRMLDYAGRDNPKGRGGWTWLVLRCAFHHCLPHCRALVLFRRSKIEELAHNTTEHVRKTKAAKGGR